MEDPITVLAVILVSALTFFYILWKVIRSAVLSALKEHSDTEQKTSAKTTKDSEI